MRCPFLCEKRVRFCEAAPLRVYVESAVSRAERCSQPDFKGCELLPNGASGGGRCPLLREQTAQFCSAAPTCLVPAGDGLLSACHSDAHRYCELYLDVAPPPPCDSDSPEHGDAALPAHLAYAHNHMWIDVQPDGTCHVGLDALAAEALGSVDQVEFVHSRGSGRAAAVVTVGGVPLHIVFPNALEIVATNTRLRTYPESLTEDPYRRGWLFRSRERIAPGVPKPDEGLLRGAEAAAWMRSESERIGRSLHRWIGATHVGAGSTAAAPTDLERSARFHVLQELFAPEATQGDRP